MNKEATLPVPRSAAILTIVVLLCAAAASGVTLFWQRAFPDPTPALGASNVLAEARGWSAATLLIAVPLAAVSLAAASRGSLRAQLVWAGSLAYFVYTYLEFAVSPPFTPLYLLYIVAFACAIPALVMGVASIDVGALRGALGEHPPRRVVAIFSLLIAAFLTLAWLRGIVSRTLAGSFGWPTGGDAVGHVVHALDLGLQVPLGISTGLMLLRRRPAGDLLAAIMLVNAVCMGAALTGMVAWTAAASGAGVSRAWPFAVVWSIAVVLALAFFHAGTNDVGSREAHSDAQARPNVASASHGAVRPKLRAFARAHYLRFRARFAPRRRANRPG